MCTEYVYRICVQNMCTECVQNMCTDMCTECVQNMCTEYFSVHGYETRKVHLKITHKTPEQLTGKARYQ